MKIKHFLTIIVVFMTCFSYSQANYPKVYFDKLKKASKMDYAYYYRVKTDKPNYYKSYYQNDDAIYFEGYILKADTLDENKNIYTGTCTWYYKNGRKKMIVDYNAEGKENGKCYIFSESGKIEKEIDYKNGKIENKRFKEFDADGNVTLIFEEDFKNNDCDWDIYKSEASSSRIVNNTYEIISYQKEGTSRLINLPIVSDSYIIEASLDNSELNKESKLGLIWGFKDWKNYNYFAISGNYYYVGSVYEGINTLKSSSNYSANIKTKGENILKVFADKVNTIYTINGSVQFRTYDVENYGNSFGFVLSGKSKAIVKNIIVKEIKHQQKSFVEEVDKDVIAIGTGFIFNKEGYLLTNNHVVEIGKKIFIDHTFEGKIKQYEASVVIKDEENDLAILKILGDSFPKLEIPYSFKESGFIEVGASAFTVGYPYALSGMGKEIKFTDGKISSKTGFNNSLNSFQTSIPVQPGNSGGPVFNEKGQLIGIINSKFRGAENVSYAVKLNYIKNLIELLSEPVQMPMDDKLINATLEEKIKAISNFVVMIKIK